MIGYLQGRVLHKFDEVVFLLVGGIGYEVYVSSALWQLVNEGNEAAFYIHQHVREDQLTLYGFAQLEERQLFKKLISVSGIGPKSALAALSAAPMQELIQAIHLEDHAVFQSVSGIGPKTAKRLVIELKSKVDAIATGISLTAKEQESPSARQDVIDALEALGYSPIEIRESIKEMQLHEMETQEAIREVLQKMKQ